LTAQSSGRGRLILESMTRLGESLAGVIHVESVVAHLVVTINELFEPDGLTIALSEPEHINPRIVEAVGPPHLVPPTTVWDAFRAHGVLSEDPAHAALIMANWANPPKAWMGAPITADRHKLGLVFLARNGPELFTATDLAVLRPVLAQTAIALVNSHLLSLLEAGKQEWEQTVDAVPDAFCIVGREGEVRRANRAFADLVHTPVEEVVGRRWEELVPDGAKQAIARALAYPSAEEQHEVKLGGRLFGTRAHPIGRRSDRYVLVLEDQTDKRSLQDQIAQSAKMSAIGQLIAGIAHDLNNPLASVAGFAEYLVQTGEDIPPRIVEPLRAIHQDAERASNIVKNLLTFARAQQGGRRPLAIGKVLDVTLMLLNNQLLAYHVQTKVRIDNDLPHVEGNATQLQQVFVNVITNAAQAIHSSGLGSTIFITAERWLDGLAVTVENDGPSIPEEVADRVFEAFFTTKPEGEGTGLGLSICHGIVTEHGGKIYLLDEPIQARSGCAFRIELPGSDSPFLAPTITPQEPQGLRVLVVDDEPHILHYMRAALEDWGHSVTVASDGREAMHIITNESFDVIITDLRMPRVGGKEFFEILAQRRPEAAQQVVFCTGDTVDTDTLSFLENVNRPHIKKPFSLGELRAVLSEAAGEHSHR